MRGRVVIRLQLLVTVLPWSLGTNTVVVEWQWTSAERRMTTAWGCSEACLCKGPEAMFESLRVLIQLDDNALELGDLRVDVTHLRK